MHVMGPITLFNTTVSKWPNMNLNGMIIIEHTCFGSRIAECEGSFVVDLCNGAM